MTEPLHFIKEFQRIYQFHDEPKFYQYSAKIQLEEHETDGNIKEFYYANGSSLTNDKLAIRKAISEACERYACMVYKKEDLIYDTYDNLKDAIDPESFTTYSKEQKKDKRFEDFRFTKKTPFYWMPATSINDNKRMFIPANLVYHNYKLEPKERLIMIPISNGAAAGGTYKTAIHRGFLELIERDAYTIAWLNRLPLPKVDLSTIKDKRIRLIEEICERYRLELHVMDMTTDIEVPSFISLVINRTGIGPAVFSGIKTDHEPVKAIVGSFTESLHMRCKIRKDYKEIKGILPRVSLNLIDNSKDRGLWWYAKDKIDLVKFWIDQEATPLREYDNMNLKGYKSYYVDLTLPEIKAAGVHVVKVFIPKLQPFHLSEAHRVLGGKRLYEEPFLCGYKPTQLNPYPHPFL